MEIGSFAIERRHGKKELVDLQKEGREREKEELSRDERTDEDSENRYRVYTKGERPKAGALGCYPLRRERGM